MKDLKKEAIEAFKTKKSELPADAGYPVIREKRGDVFFLRSLDDWHQYVKEQKFYTLLFRLVFGCIVLALLAIGIGICLKLSVWLILTICVLSQAIPLIFLALSLKVVKRKAADIYVYVGEKKKIYSIV